MTTLDELDRSIVQACNDLMRFKGMTMEQRGRHRNERDHLYRLWQAAHHAWITARRRPLRRLERSPDLTYHSEACKQAFAGMYVPAFAAAQQAQLCFHVHLLTMDERQMTMHQNHVRAEAAALHIVIRKLQEERELIEFQLLNELSALEQEIRALEVLWEETNVKIEFNQPNKSSELLNVTCLESDSDSDAEEDDSAFQQDLKQQRDAKKGKAISFQLVSVATTETATIAVGTASPSFTLRSPLYVAPSRSLVM